MENWGLARILAAMVATALAFTAVLVAIIAPISFYTDRRECGYVTQNTGTETLFVKNHVLSWDCYVKVDGKWIPIDRWRGDSDE